MTGPTKTEPEDKLTDEVIDHLYEVALDPMRYEVLLDRWEDLMRARLTTSQSEAGRPGEVTLSPIARHMERAGEALDRMMAEPPPIEAETLLSQVAHNAAFIIDREMRIVTANGPAAAALGLGAGAELGDLALAPGEAEILARGAERVLFGNTGASTVLRVHAAGSDKPLLVSLRPFRTEDGTPHALAVTSQMSWPKGFGEVLRRAFDLTNAEAEVMRALAEGHSLAAIAALRGRSVATLRAQLKSVMAKTETTSQSELVRLTLSTMEIARFSDAAVARLAEQDDAHIGLVPRKFQTLTLADGRRMDYLILGDPKGRPCLYLHLDYGLSRWPASAEAEAARAGIRIIVPIRGGYGKSDPVPRQQPYLAQLAEDHLTLLDHLGVGTVPVVSLGGDSYLAIALHAAAPERIGALICCAGALPLSRPEQYQRMHKWHRFILAGARYTPHLLPFMVKAGFALARRLGKRGFIHAVYGKSIADVATFEIPEVMEAMVTGSEVALSKHQSAHDSFAREVIAHETTDWTDEIAALQGKVPVHFLNGLQDPEVPPATLQEYRRDYPWIDFRIYPDAGQLIFFLKWRDVLPLILRHLG